MTLDRKSIAIVLMIQFFTGLLVFVLTRAYYIDQETPSVNSIPSAPMTQSDMSTDQLIDSLQNYSQLNLSSDPAEVDRQANEAFQRGDYAQAAELYQRVIELAPHKSEPHNNLGLTLHYLGRSSEAIPILQRGTELDPNFQRIWLTLGFVQQGVGNIEEAKAALEHAVELGADTAPGINASELLKELP